MFAREAVSVVVLSEELVIYTGKDMTILCHAPIGEDDEPDTFVAQEL